MQQAISKTSDVDARQVMQQGDAYIGRHVCQFAHAALGHCGAMTRCVALCDHLLEAIGQLLGLVELRTGLLKSGGSAAYFQAKEDSTICKYKKKVTLLRVHELHRSAPFVHA